MKRSGGSRRRPGLLAGMAAALALSAGAAVFAASPAPRMSPDTEAYRSDFQAFCRQVEDNYAYFDARETDWASACAALGERAAAATSRDEFIAVLEAALRQLYDTHAHLATNTPRSPRLVPSGVDVMARWIDGKAVVTDVWPGSGAARSGLRAGDEILMLDGVPVADAAAAFTPIHLRTPDVRARNFGLQVALAGRHEVPRVALRVRSGDATRDVAYAAGRARSGRHLDVSLRDGVAVVRIENALGEESLIGDFDRALDTIGSAGALVLDLRDTPSGGTSTVARGILGRFVKMSSPYQRHELVSEFRRTGVKRHWVEYVAPRPPVLDIPVVVLVGPWTGSMGEGLAIGFHYAVRAAVVGRPMAKLLGALEEFQLPASGIAFRIPAEKLFHVDGTPRESFVPCPLVTREAGDADDAELRRAIDLARRLARPQSGSTAAQRTDPRTARCEEITDPNRGR